MADAPAQPPFAVDDRVVYPNLGVCRVTGFETLVISNQTVSFLTLKREVDGSVLRVPPGKLQAAGIRKLAGKQEISDVFRFLKSDSDKATLDWKQRARTNTDRMAHGGLMGLAEVVKGLAVLSELRPLPTKERELYDSARTLLVAELAASLSCSMCDAEDTLDVALSPPGKERPRRTVEEFQRGADGEPLGDDDFMGMDADLDGIPPEEPPGESPGEAEEEAAAPTSRKAGKPTAKPKAKVKAPAQAILSDDEATVTMARAVALPAEPKKRGRPPKDKAKAAAPPEPPKKRGRPAGSKKATAKAKAAPAKKKGGR